MKLVTNGILNGQVCTPLYGSSCTYCSNQCKNVTLNGPYCGDNTCNGNEKCSTCSQDCGVCPSQPKCGDGIINQANETCDLWNIKWTSLFSFIWKFMHLLFYSM